VGPGSGLDGRKISSSPGFDSRPSSPYRLNYSAQGSDIDSSNLLGETKENQEYSTREYIILGPHVFHMRRNSV